MPPETDTTHSTPIPPMPLDYAPVAKGRVFRRWLMRLLVLLAVGAAALMSWYWMAVEIAAR